MSLAAQNLLGGARVSASYGGCSPARIPRDSYEDLLVGLVDQLAQSSVRCIRIECDRSRTPINDCVHDVGTASLR